MFEMQHGELIRDPGARLEFEALYKALGPFLRTAHNDDGSLIADTPAQVSDLGLPVGTIVSYAGATVPTGWLLCDGSAINRATYSTLFTAIGTAYGVGDGVTTFELPDMRGRFPFGKATAGTGSTLGAEFGSIDHTHTGPSHSHTIAEQAAGVTGAASTGTTSVPSATVAVQSGAGTTVATDTHTHTLAHTHSVPAHDHGATTGAAGAGNTGATNPPGLVFNWLILYT